MGFHSPVFGDVRSHLKENLGETKYAFANWTGQLDSFNEAESLLTSKSTITQEESNNALGILGQQLGSNKYINQDLLTPKIAEWQRTSDNFYQNQRDVAAKATADAQAKATADAQAQATSKAKAFSDFDAIGWEDPNEVYSSIATPQPEPSVAFIANNYNTPSLLGNVQAAEEYAPAPQPSGSILGGVLDSAKENAGEIGAGAIAAKALANTRGWAEHGATKETLGKIGKQSWGKTWGQEKVSGYDKNFKAKPGAVKVSHPSYIKQGVQSLFGKYAPNSNVGGGTPLSQKGFQYSTVKNILNSPTAKVLSKVATRLGVPGLIWGVGSFIYNNNSAFHRTAEERLEDKRKYRRRKRERAEEVRAKAQAVADAKAKVEAEAEQARQTEKEKQRMVESNSFSDTDSGSFDSGGNYSDWGSQESYDDDFGEDSHW